MRHGRAEDERDDDGERKDRLDEDDRCQGQRGSLTGVAEHVGKEAEEPSRAADQPGHEPDAEGVLVGDLLRFGELEHVARARTRTPSRGPGRLRNTTSGDTGRQYGGLCGGLSIRRSASITATARRRPRRLDRYSFVQISPGLGRWRAPEPRVAQFLDLESRLAHHPVDRAIEVASGREPLLETVQAVLPTPRSPAPGTGRARGNGTGRPVATHGAARTGLA